MPPKTQLSKTRYNVYLPEKLHQKAKAKAALLGISFSNLIEKLISDYLNKK